ncbi:S-adenosyl-L-methionine-dependent methyltransferase [Guyanagaster necrorhizus]|uniref:S-adenosyl-L-methionine-dependent methyltransferase n=1 Tax=Guyanagaster necrorhizus TaxID=856835 RepID=A0A9P7W3L9_9AGAR|nr:S-adenosyl-L-methionine-dependent methyltransferase [Guyanagaster necrorhizus MCA 3950]KAG7451568.1 S-adenosyl-L-methionine-dependent methyltransferase [Guyanagaster necrorhizus MCA 3950]
MAIIVPNVNPTTIEDWACSAELTNSFLLDEDHALRAALKNAEDKGLPHEIAVPAEHGKLLQLLATSIRAKRILEIGTLGGYSAIWLARALPEDGELVTLELNERYAQVARENIAIAGLASKVKVVVGPARTTLAKMKPEHPFDFIFIDADKASNTDYFKHAKRLVRRGGTIIVDNMMLVGLVANPTYTDDNVEGVRALLKELKNDPDVDCTAVGTACYKGFDGFLYAVRK